MRILIDTNNCEVIDITLRVAKSCGINCFLLCDSSCYFEREGATTIVISENEGNIGFKYKNILQSGDIVITQSHSLAKICLEHGAIPVIQDGIIYNDSYNVNVLLEQQDNQNFKRIGKQDAEFGSRLAVIISLNSE